MVRWLRIDGYKLGTVFYRKGEEGSVQIWEISLYNTKVLDFHTKFANFAM